MNQPNKGRGMSLALLIVLILVGYFVINDIFSAEVPTYHEIVMLFEDNKVSDFKVDETTRKLTYKLRENADTKLNYELADVNLFLDDVLPLVRAYNAENPAAPITYDIVATSNVASIILALLPTLLLAGGLVFFIYLMRKQQQDGGMGMMSNFGRAKARIPSQSSRRYTFDDVAGADEEKEELQEIVEFLNHPEEFNSLGARIPKGVMLIGPPGTGKTLLAKAVAGEANVPFMSISGSDFVEMYVGVGASRVRDLFEKAKKQAPSIVFIDEIDAVGRQRGAGLGGGNDEREQTLNQLLVELDGFEPNSGVIVMAATNRSDVLDPALLRPGRFDRQIYVNIPDVKGREEILKVHSRGKPLAPDIDLSIVAKSTIGFTGADLENILNEAALIAARAKRKAITQRDIEDATTKVLVGPEKRSRVVTDRERRLTAFHEAGHAIVTFYAQPETPVQQVSIIPRGRAGGFTLSLPTEDQNYSTKREMHNQITTLLGGRAAEELELGDISTGASNDLDRSTRIARAMVTKYGFSDSIGPVVWSSEQDEVFLGRDFAQNRNYSERVASEIDEEIQKVVTDCYEAAKSILIEHRDRLLAVVSYLLGEEILDSDNFNKIMTGTMPALPDAAN